MSVDRDPDVMAGRVIRANHYMTLATLDPDGRRDCRRLLHHSCQMLDLAARWAAVWPLSVAASPWTRRMVHAITDRFPWAANHEGLLRQAAGHPARQHPGPAKKF